MCWHCSSRTLLVSKPLRNAFSAAGIERRGIFEVDKYTAGATKAWASVDPRRGLGRLQCLIALLEESAYDY